MKASEDEPARRAARRGARLAKPARHTLQLDRDEGRGPFKIPRGEGTCAALACAPNGFGP
eukprot:scaffold6137_cov147-Isochrysis_galbana.AAC.7